MSSTRLPSIPLTPSSVVLGEQLGLKLLRPEAAAALGNDPSFADLASTVDLQR